jgi:hypothetical protein
MLTEFGNGINDGARHQMLEMLHGSPKGFGQKGLHFCRAFLTCFPIVKAGEACGFFPISLSLTKASGLGDLREACLGN